MDTIAGIRLPDSALATDAEALVREHSPGSLVDHCRRTYVFGTLATRAANLVVREELAYVAALLHDLRLTERYAGERRFEVDGAEAAHGWATANGLSPDEAQVIWDAIALHTSIGITADRCCGGGLPTSEDMIGHDPFPAS